MEFLTQASVVVELFGFGYAASSFAVYAHRRVNQSVLWQPRSAVRSVAKAMKQPERLSVEIETSQKRKLSPVEQLRQQCQQAGVKWRDAHGKNKHLKKDEMIVALQAKQVKQVKRVTPPTQPNPAIAPKSNAPKSNVPKTETASKTKKVA